MGFCPLWINWIKGCISSYSYSFNINGNKTGYVCPSRGIRQGDPLSPYLFLFCAQDLANLLTSACRNNLLTGIKISRNGPAISHLFFADDSLIFCKANSKKASEITRIFQIYELASGQKINIEKSAVLFSRNTSQANKQDVLQTLGNIQHVSQAKYLGLPMVIRRSKNSTFRFLKDKMTSKLQGWKGKMLSNAGKEVLLKSMALALPSYTMSVFKLLDGLCKALSSMIAKFWWENDQGEKKMHWKKWWDLTEIKGKGRLGFRDIKCFNEALLAKQAWRLLTKPELLVSKAKAKSGSSLIWQSIQSAILLLEDGIRRQIGNGRSTAIWKDRWIPNEVHRRTCKGDKWCKCCGEEVETLEHLFFNCKAREEAWKTFPIKWDGIQESSWNFWKWWEALQGARCRVNDISHIEATTNFLWQLWKARNACNFNKESTKGNLISSRALEEWLEYKQMWDLEKRESKKDDPEVPTMTITKELQDQHVILMFTDATMDKKRSRGGLGIAAKDHNGKLVKTWAIPTGMMKDAAILEVEAIRSAMLKALEEGWTSLLIHSDCKCLVDRFNHRYIGLSLLDVLVDDIVHLSRSF
ncbi:uncharacterized protein [Coffea arabica]|uniref:Reverse transcriptase domain-containing protein n=1 Tax=Coffea arabica TaxID=13443 RepID=A0ABM4VU59_COFAR